MLAQKGQNVEARLARAIAHKIPIPNFPLPMRQDPRQRFQPRLHDSFHSDYLSRRITPTRKEKSRPVQRVSQSKLLTSKPNLLPFPFSSHSLTLSSIVKRPDSPPTIFSDTLLFLGTWTLLPPHCSSSSIAHSPFPPLPPLSLFPAPIHPSLSLSSNASKYPLSRSPCFHAAFGLRLSTAGSAINFRAPTPSNISLPFVRASSSFCRGPPVHAGKRAAYYG